MRDIITFRGKRDLWIDFVSKVKKQKKEVWDVLSVFIKKYLNQNDRQSK